MIFDRKVQTCIFDTGKTQGDGRRRQLGSPSEQNGMTLSTTASACMPASELEHKLEALKADTSVAAELSVITQAQISELKVANHAETRELKAETRGLKAEITELKALLRQLVKPNKA